MDQSIMPSKLCKWGNSLGVRLPQYIAERTGLTSGDYLYFTLRDNGEIVIKPVKAKGILPEYVSDAADQITTLIPPRAKW
jgi:antitoxin MazE